MIYLVCDSMYAGYETTNGTDWSLVDVGFSARFKPAQFNYKMDIDTFVDIYDCAWPMHLTSGDLADWEKVN